MRRCIGRHAASFAGVLIASTLAASSAHAGRLRNAATAAGSAAAAQALPFSSRFVYKADGKRLSEVLTEFCAAQGVAVVVDPHVEGIVSGNFDASPREFLDGISKAFALLWYFDGTALYFYPAGAIQSRIFRLKGYRREQVVQLLDSLHLSSSRYPLRFDAANSTLLVYGPPRHVELVGLAIESLDVGAIEGNRRIAKVFPLRYATAGDLQLGNVAVPGIVSTLRGVYGGGQSGAAGGAPGSPASILTSAQNDAARNLAPLTRAAQSLYEATGMGGGSRPDLHGGAGTSGAGMTDDRTGATPAPRTVRSPLEDDIEDDTPAFQADEGGNAVIVYCKARRMDELATLIRTLDVQPVLVELEATIIDVSVDSLDELGIDWSLQNSGGQIGLQTPAGPSTTTLASGISSAPYVVSTLLENAGRTLLAHVSALAGNGRARVVSKPRVLGMANRPATMSDKEIANVRVAGTLDVNLFQVEAGTTLQVTPQVGAGSAGGPLQIKLSVYIQDGNFESSSVDSVPVVKKTEIRTEARVLEGESLLIGGISIDSESAGVTGLPGLRDLPVIGALFRQSSHQTSRVERMFLLTPRVIVAPPAGDLNVVASSATHAAVSQTFARPQQSAQDTALAVTQASASPHGSIDAHPAATTPRSDDLPQALLQRLASPATYSFAAPEDATSEQVRKP